MREAGLPIVPFVAMSAAAPVTYHDAVGAVGSQEVSSSRPTMGSSVGVSKARTAAEFDTGCRLAMRFDSKILIERSVAPIRKSSAPCSRMPTAASAPRARRDRSVRHARLYSYDAKYLDADGALLQVPAKVPPAIADQIRELAIKTFRVLGCEGMAPHRLLSPRRAGVRERGEHPSRLHRYQHVPAAMAGQRTASVRAHGCPDRPRTGAPQALQAPAFERE